MVIAESLNKGFSFLYKDEVKGWTGQPPESPSNLNSSIRQASAGTNSQQVAPVWSIMLWSITSHLDKDWAESILRLVHTDRDFSLHLQKYSGERTPLTAVGLELQHSWGEAGPRVLYYLPKHRPIDEAQRHQVHHSAINSSHLEHKTPQMTHNPEMAGKPVTPRVQCSLNRGYIHQEGIFIARLQKLISYVQLCCIYTLQKLTDSLLCQMQTSVYTD